MESQRAQLDQAIATYVEADLVSTGLVKAVDIDRGHARISRHRGPLISWQTGRPHSA